MNTWMNTEEAAAHLGIKRRTLLLWVRQGKIPAHPLSGTKRRVWRFLREELDSTLRSRPVISSPSLSGCSEMEALN